MKQFLSSKIKISTSCSLATFPSSSLSLFSFVNHSLSLLSFANQSKYPFQTISPIMPSFILMMLQPLSKLPITIFLTNPRSCVTDIYPKSLPNMGDPTDNNNQKEAVMLLLDHSFHLQNTFQGLQVSHSQSNLI